LIAPNIRAEDLVGAEWAEWFHLTPAERWRESGRLWDSFLALGAHLIPNPILKVLSSMREHRVRALLMGGQACISYGAAEFSRDVDLAIVSSLRNIAALRKAIVFLQAEVIAVPPFDVKYLRKGHAVHFRCHDPEVEGLRVDVMSHMRGVDSFEKLWSRRTLASEEAKEREADRRYWEPLRAEIEKLRYMKIRTG
jgi:hypothetical protein